MIWRKWKYLYSVAYSRYSPFPALVSVRKYWSEVCRCIWGGGEGNCFFRSGAWSAWHSLSPVKLMAPACCKASAGVRWQLTKSQLCPGRGKWPMLKMRPLDLGGLTPLQCFHVPVNATDPLIPACKLKSALWLTLWKNTHQSEHQSTCICLKFVFLSQGALYTRKEYSIHVCFVCLFCFIFNNSGYTEKNQWPL